MDPAILEKFDDLSEKERTFLQEQVKKLINKELPPESSRLLGRAYNQLRVATGSASDV